MFNLSPYFAHGEITGKYFLPESRELTLMIINTNKKYQVYSEKCKQSIKKPMVKRFIFWQSLVLITDSTLFQLKQLFINFSIESLGIYNAIK